MIRGRRRLPLAVLLACALAGASTARADDNSAAVDASLYRTYPRRQADLAKWLKREMIPGQTTPDEVVAIFGRRYHHLMEDPSSYAYWLDRLGVYADGPYFIVVFHFDAQTGRLVRAAVEDREERQTGFHIETLSGQ